MPPTCICFASIDRHTPKHSHRQFIALQRGRRARQRRAFLAWSAHVRHRARVSALIERMQQPLALVTRLFRQWAVWAVRARHERDEVRVWKSVFHACAVVLMFCFPSRVRVIELMKVESSS
jgi:hypothetical protein